MIQKTKYKKWASYGVVTIQYTAQPDDKIIYNELKEYQRRNEGVRHEMVDVEEDVGEKVDFFGNVAVSSHVVDFLNGTCKQ